MNVHITDITVSVGLRENRTQEGTHHFYRFRTPLRGRTHRFYRVGTRDLIFFGEHAIWKNGARDLKFFWGTRDLEKKEHAIWKKKLGNTRDLQKKGTREDAI